MHKFHYHLFFILLIFYLLFQTPPEAYSQSSQQSQKRNQDYNVIIMFLDTLRPDHLGCYGYSKQTSPNIDQLAKESFVFEQNFSPTSGSFASLLTSLYPASHGVFSVGKDQYPVKIKTLPEILCPYNYKTVWFGIKDGPHMLSSLKCLQVMELFSKNLKLESVFLGDWLEKNKDERFLLFFHTYKMRNPYDPSLKYRAQFIHLDDKKIVKKASELQRLIFYAIKEALRQKKGEIWRMLGDLVSDPFFLDLFEGDFDDDKEESIKSYFTFKNKFYLYYDRIRNYVDWNGIDYDDVATKKYLEALYDACILEVDSEIIGPLIEQLKKTGLYDKTIIVIFSSHGEEFNEHGGKGHGTTLYDEITRVPMIIRVPHWLKQGRHIRELTQTIDIMPTICNLLKIPVSQYVQGKTLVDLMNNKDAVPPYEYVFGQKPSDKPYMSSIRSKEWKLIVHEDGKKELYSLITDPGEQHNIYSQQQDIASKLEEKLKAWETSLPRYQDREYSFLPEIN